MHRDSRWIFLLAILPVSLALMAPGQSTAAPSDEAAIRSADAEWSKAASAKDLERTLSFYAADAVILAPNFPAAVGRPAIREVWIAEFKDPAYALSWRWQSVEVSRSGDLAYSRGMYDGSYTVAGKAVHENGKYLAVWKNRATAPGRSWPTCTTPMHRRCRRNRSGGVSGFGFVRNQDDGRMFG